ncbi:thioredoxin domain-containing protein [Candidatus Daviesbacteria bacterium]|nr:thioredoxin domain-containing protein [Candidatus Daviesbacteria bacterium]
MTQEAKVLLGIGVATIAILAGAVFMFSKNPPAPTADTNILVKSNSHKIASDSAKITVVEFGDYQCPACGLAYPVVERILQDYSGRINFVFRNFPLPQHQNALTAAEAAEAAAAQGKFWEMHNKLYINQGVWSEDKQVFDLFMGYGKDLGLDLTRFEQEVKANKYSDIINQDQNDGSALGVNSTPTFFIGGQKIEGVPNYDTFKNKIDEELKKTY